MNKNTRRKITVFFVDDHPVVREGVRAYLSTQALISIVGEAGDHFEALRKLKTLAPPDVILLDIELPGMDGGELAKRLRQIIPSAKILAFSAHSSLEFVMRMAHCGAHGYVMKDTATTKLVEAICHVNEGGLYFPSDMVDAILMPQSKLPLDKTNKMALTARERDVLSLLADGMANKEVGRKLGISVRTAEAHREHLSRKLNITTVAGLTKYAIQKGLSALSLPDVGQP